MSLETFMNWARDNHLIDLSGMLSIAISLVGFTATIFNVAKSRTAAQRAEEAAVEAKNRIMFYDTLSNVADAVSAMEEIKRHQREENWKLLLERYSYVRKLLIGIRVTHPRLTDDQQSALQGAIKYLYDAEISIEQALRKDDIPDNASRITALMSKHLDNVRQVLAELKSVASG